MTYDVALSYASTQEAYAQLVLQSVSRAGLSVFSYKGRRDALAHSLPVELTEIFLSARLCVILADAAYIKSGWCQLESRAAYDREMSSPGTVLLGKFDPDVRPLGSLPNAQYHDLRSTPADEFSRIVLLRLGKPSPHQDDIEPTHRERTYGLFFGFPEYRVAYIPVFRHTWHEHYDERSQNELRIEARSVQFRLLAPFDSGAPTQMPPENLVKCRLDFCASDEEGPPLHTRILRLRLQPTRYLDYLRSEEQMNYCSFSGGRTLREDFLEELRSGDEPIRPISTLTNIVGVGLFVITRDGQIVVTSHPFDSHVYPGRRTFSASGTMPWGACPDPFTAITIKAYEEIQHLLDPRYLKLFAFGVDARKLYFQFSFVEERTQWTFRELESHYEAWKQNTKNAPRKLIGVGFDEVSVCETLIRDCWEPAAEAALLTLLAKRLGKQAVVKELRRRSHDWWKRAMRDEWDHRASQPGLLPDMSVRYPRDRLDEESTRYLEHVIRFLGDHVRGKSVVEIGPGTGRISERLLALDPGKLVCIEQSPGMIARLMKRLGAENSFVDYRCGFAQDILSEDEPFDIVVCSLVLIHNVGVREYQNLIKKMCSSSSHVFVFEDVRPRNSSPATELRSREVIKDSFYQHGFVLQKEDVHKLFDDDIAFLHMSRP
jgi:2-polyprenyl-3-methyl-5-hydroxy-6-metoxy-1,4-benzoquinol methylase